MEKRSSFYTLDRPASTSAVGLGDFDYYRRDRGELLREPHLQWSVLLKKTYSGQLLNQTNSKKVNPCAAKDDSAKS
jgi:hypothetical protein